MPREKKATAKKPEQVAALPIRISEDGEVDVLLISSRETHRWIIPKGWTSRRLDDAKAAEREARQEAGIEGKIAREPVGQYRYRKVLPNGSRMLNVAVYVLWVKKQRKNWREKSERARIWTSFEDAEKLVREPGLKRLFSELALELQKHKSPAPVLKIDARAT
jgi:8-oxo-dGTP pyrophosphatase MutT (NUDIX family)